MCPFKEHSSGLSAEALKLLDHGLNEIRREMQAAADGQPIFRSERMSKQAKQKFRIGQEVSFTPAKLSMPTSSQNYKIIRCLPRERGEQEYRIKSSTELFERVAKESELSLRA